MSELPTLIPLWSAARWAMTPQKTPDEVWRGHARQIQAQLELRAEHGHQPQAKLLEFDRHADRSRSEASL